MPEKLEQIKDISVKLNQVSAGKIPLKNCIEKSIEQLISVEEIVSFAAIFDLNKNDIKETIKEEIKDEH